jgi:hypothetical protein
LKNKEKSMVICVPDHRPGKRNDHLDSDFSDLLALRPYRHRLHRLGRPPASLITLRDG